MLVDLVPVTTEDGVRLHGALELPAQVSPSSPVDAWLCIHGTGSNFYSASLLAGLAPKLLASGAAVLRGNTRGHDVICTGPSASGHTWLGAAFERVDESPRDLLAWIAFLRERGFRRIGLFGHSLGAVKALYTLAVIGESRKRGPGSQTPAREDLQFPVPSLQPVSVLVAASPPRLSYEYFCASPRGDEFRAALAAAQALVADGRAADLLRVRFPLSYYVSAGGYVDRYGPGERYNVLRMADRINCPTLVTYGSNELGEVAFRGMPEEMEKLRTEGNRLQTAIVAGADHQYTACHDVLAARIESWLGRLPPNASAYAS